MKVPHLRVSKNADVKVSYIIVSKSTAWKAHHIEVKVLHLLVNKSVKVKVPHPVLR